jgi:hypothetical protein
MKVKIGVVFDGERYELSSSTSAGVRVQTPPTVDWSKYIATSSNTLISDLLLTKCGVGCTLLPSRDQVFPMHNGISSNQLFTTNLDLELP